MRWIITASQYPPRVTNVPTTVAAHLPPTPLSPLSPLPPPCPPPLRAAIPVQSLCVCERVVTPGSMFLLVLPACFSFFLSLAGQGPGTTSHRLLASTPMGLVIQAYSFSPPLFRTNAKDTDRDISWA